MAIVMKLQKQIFSLLVIGSVSSPALAETPMASVDQSVQDVLACRTLSSNLERLTCLDAALPALASAFPEAEMTAEEKKEAEERQLEKKKMAAEAAFGQSINQKPIVVEKSVDPATAKTEELQELNSVVSKVEFTNLGKAIIYLENGQVWRQLDSDSRKIRVKSSLGKQATLKKKLMGSYAIRISKGRSIRVRRIK